MDAKMGKEDKACRLLYPLRRLTMELPESPPRKSLHLPRQQKMRASDGKSDGNALC